MESTGNDIQMDEGQLCQLIPRTKTTAPVLENFDVLKVLGTGGYGKVLLVKKNIGADTGCHYAMKCIKKSELDKINKSYQHTKSERSVLGCINSPFVVELFYAFQTRSKLHFVMELVQGGELRSRLDKEGFFYENDAKFYLAEITCALEYLHNNDIVYRDLKLENIMLDSCGHIKLVDFGMTKEKMYKNTLTSTFAGTIEYMAPEMLKRYTYTRAVDFWSLGCVAFEFLTGITPFDCGSRKETMRKAKEGIFRCPSHISRTAKDFIHKLLNKTPQIRLGVRESIRTHAFFCGINWEDVINRRLEPPFVPSLKGADDTSLFEEEFTNQNTKLTVGEPSDPQDPDHFEGFDFISEEFSENN